MLDTENKKNKKGRKTEVEEGGNRQTDLRLSYFHATIYGFYHFGSVSDQLLLFGGVSNQLLLRNGILGPLWRPKIRILGP